MDRLVLLKRYSLSRDYFPLLQSGLGGVVAGDPLSNRPGVELTELRSVLVAGICREGIQIISHLFDGQFVGGDFPKNRNHRREHSPVFCQCFWGKPPIRKVLAQIAGHNVGEAVAFIPLYFAQQPLFISAGRA